MRRISCALSILVACASTLAAAGVPDAPTANPEIYKVLLDNPHVRLLEVRVPRGGQTVAHSHPDSTVYVVKGGAVEFTHADGSVTKVDLVAGQTLFAPAEVHSAKNVGRSEIVGIIHELKDTAMLSAKLTVFERAELVAMLEKARAETQELVGRASGDLWSKKPAEGRWSVGEVVEHLGAAEGLLFGMATGTLAQPEEPNWTAIAAGTSVGTLADFLLDRSQKFQAPEPLQPKGGMTRAEAMTRYGGAREVTLDFARTTEAPLKAHAAQMPVGKMNAHQLLAFIALHNMRHNQQIAEALEQLGAK